VDASDRPVVEAAAGGTDTVIATSDWLLEANVERLILGVGALNGTGNALDNTITGNDQDNLLTGLGGEDTLDGGLGSDRMLGGAGDDVYHVDNAGDVVLELPKEGIDTVVSYLADYGLGAEVENLTLGDDVVYGTALSGSGNELANRIEGNGSGNTLSGFGGDDTLIGNEGDDILDGGAGSDSLSGGAGADTLTGGDGDDLLDGGEDADTMSGGAGDDTYRVDDAGDVVTENPGEGTDTVIASLTYTLTNDVEVLILEADPDPDIDGTGNALDNTLIGTEGANILDGGAGADRMEGNDGGDIYIVDDAGDVVIEFLGAGIDLVRSSVDFILGANLENLELTTGAGNISGTGNALANEITGNDSDNVLTGLAGNDVLEGGAGADTMLGGTGNDIYYVDDALDAVTELASQGTDLVRSTVTYTLGANVENLELIGGGNVDGTGNALNNVIIGNSGDNIISGGAGNDTLSGGSGSDTLRGGVGNDVYYIIDAANIVEENLGEGTDTVKTTVDRGVPLEDNVENLVLLGSADIDALGNDVNNVITGNDGANRLEGGLGIDTLRGGKGDDTYVVDTRTDILVELAGQGTDTIEFGSGNAGDRLVMAANIENLLMTTAGVALDVTGNASANAITGNDAANILDGGGGNDTLDGGDGNDTLIGGAGNDTLQGGLGNDSLRGGTGNDTYLGVEAGDTIVEASGAGIDTVQTAVDGYTLGANLENLTLLVGAITGTGNGLANILTGNAVDNTLNGGAGHDTLDGGAGADTMIGGAGNDTYLVDDVGDVVVETLAGSAGGIDTVKTALTFDLAALPNVEHVVLTGLGNVNADGNASNNSLTGNDGDNVLTGLAGNDTLKGGAGNDTLLGGTGSDIMQGGAGDDIYEVNSTGDKVTELLNQGTDLVQSSISYALGANVENLELTGTANINGTGNALANSLTGNSGNNTLSGGAGDDLIDGLGGADRLLGGLGHDIFVFDVADTQVAGGAGIDTLRFTGSGESLNLNAVPNTAYTGLEIFDLTGTGDNEITADVTDILALSDTTNRLIVDGDAGDLVTLLPSGATGWTQGADESIGGVLYQTFTAGQASVFAGIDVTVDLF
jgi:Ca2+-binding RTX toxin-like protein